MVQNKGLFYKAHPTHTPEPGKHLVIETHEFDVDQAPPAGGITLRVNYASFDPYQRGRMRALEAKSYNNPFKIDEPIANLSIATVIKSDVERLQSGDVVYVGGMCPTVEYVSFGPDMAKACNKLDNPFNLDTKLFLGALGMPGLTAYSSLYEIGAPKKGETIFISAASGAVGQLVGQLAKHEGLRVIGSVGDDKKLDYILKELQFDGGFNYKKETAKEALDRLAPNGIDIYYENVGGEQLEEAISHMNNFGRIVACGMISQYNLPRDQLYGIKTVRDIVSKRLKFQGFIVSDPDMGPKYHQDHQKKVQQWIHEGTFKSSESVTKGIDNAAEGLVGLFSGKNFGKAILEISPLA